MAFFAFAVGTLIGFFIAQRLSKRLGAKLIFMFGIFFGFCGGLSFWIGFYFRNFTLTFQESKRDIVIALDLMTVGRFLSGIWVGSFLNTSGRYIEEVLEAEEATELKRRLFTAEILGFVIGPLVGLIG